MTLGNERMEKYLIKGREAIINAPANPQIMEWMKDFRQVCRVAFAKTPQKLEKLGMKAKS